MRAIYIYSKYDNRQVQLIERVQTELSSYIELIEIEDCPEILKRLVRETPALISAEEHLQGYDALLSETVDGKLLLTSEMYEKMDRSEKALHNQDNCRLDSHINCEKTKAIDNYTEELIVGGVL